MKPKTLLVSAAVFWAACGGEASTFGTGTEVNDSAGVRVVHNHSPSWEAGDGWRIRTEPLLVIGQIDGEEAYALSGVTSVLRMRDGRILVSLGSLGEVRIFDSDGRFVQTVGTRGRGPGEFEIAHRVIEGEDGAFQVWDGYAGALSYFSSAGAFLRRIDLPEASGWASGGLLDRFADGSLGVRQGNLVARHPSTTPSGPFRDSSLVLRVDPESMTSDTVARVGTLEMYYLNLGDVAGEGRIIFPRSTPLAAGSRTIVTGETDRFEFAVMSLDGTVETVVRKDHTNTPASAADIRRVREGLVSAIPESATESNRRRRTEAARVIPANPSLPAFDGLRLDSEENVWVLEARFPWDARVSWHVFDPDGFWLGDVELPEELAVDRRFRVAQIGNDFLIGVIQDELDVAYVAMYPLIK